jgi:hypothetical protein
MFMLGAPFCSVNTRLEYWPIQLNVQPLPGAYAVLVTTLSPDQRRTARQQKKSVHTIVQSGYEWIFHN